MKEIDQLKGIIGELTIANETLKKFKLRGEVDYLWKTDDTGI